MNKLLTILCVFLSSISLGQVVTDHGFKKDTNLIRIIPRINVSDSIWFDGTSITSGTGPTYAALGYSYRVSDALNALQSNHGESGARMYVEGLNASHMGAIPTYNQSLYRWMVLEWGFNDMQFNVIDTGTYATAYLRYLDTAIARGWPVSKILVLSPSYGDSSIIGAGAFMARQLMFNTCTQNIAARRSTLYLNTFGIFLTKGKEILLADGRHPNADGVTVGFLNPIVNKVKDSVSASGQAIQVNGLTELQQLKFRVTDTATRDAVPFLVDSLGNFVRGDNTTFIRNGITALSSQASSIDIKGPISTAKMLTSLYGVFTGEQPTGAAAPSAPSVRLGYSSGVGIINALTGTITGMPLVLNNVGTGQVRVHTYTGTGGAAFAAPSIQTQLYLQVIGGGVFPTAGGGTTISTTPNGSSTILARNWATSANLDLSIQSLGGKIAFGALDPVGTVNYQFTGTGYFSTSLYAGGASSATAKLHIAAGTATANTAPLKLTAGTRTTASEAGTIEYETGKFVFQSDALEVDKAALAVTTTDGVIIQNPTAAAAGAQQISPALNLKGFGWGTTAGTSQSVEWKIYNLPVQGTVPTGGLTFSNSINGGALSTRLVLSSGGVLAMTGNITASGQIATSNGNVVLGTAGNKITIATGSNASIGTATLVGGTVTVATTAALTASKIFVTVVTPGGTQGFLSVPTIVNATSFDITSTSGTETSTVNWWIVN
jgi:hypothetical protein